jgi:hypothetical protein
VGLRGVRRAERTSTRGVLGLPEGTSGSVIYVGMKLLVRSFGWAPKSRSLTNRLVTQVHPDYFCNLDPNFMRLDHLQRPELNKGTVDFLVPDDYWAIEPPENLNPSYASVGPSSKRRTHRPPQPMNYVFAFDISVDAVKSGFLRSSCDALRTTIYQETKEGVACKLPAGSKIAIISYDCVINVYNLVGDPCVHDTYNTNNRSPEWVRYSGRARCARY